MPEIPADLNIVDPLAFVRSHPERFFPAGITASRLADYLMGTALEVGACDVTALRHRDWWVVGSSDDWLGLGRIPAPVHELFSRVIALPEAGQNSIRAEVLVMAFAHDVVVASATTIETLAGIGDSGWLRELLLERGWQRAVAFRTASGTELPVAAERAHTR